MVSNNIIGRWLIINTKVFVAQTSVNDCGAACLTMILKLNGLNVSLKEVKERLKMDEDGISAYEIIRLAKEYHLNGAGYKGYELSGASTPFIAHVINDDKRQHFVVVLKVSEKGVLVADPASMVAYVSADEFKAKYTGVAILFESVDKFAFSSFLDKKTGVKVIVLSLLVCVTGILIPYFLSIIISIVDGKTTRKFFPYFLFAYLFITVVRELITYVKKKASLKFQFLLDSRLTTAVIERLLSLPHQFYQRHGPGELIAKINDLSYVKEMLYIVIESLPVNVILVLGSLVMVSVLEKWMLFINLVLFFSFYLINKRFFKKHYFKTRDLQARNERLNDVLADFVNGILTIKNLVKERYFINGILGSYHDTIKLYEDMTSKYYLNEFKLSLITCIIPMMVIYMLVIKRFSLASILFILSLEDIIINAVKELFFLYPNYANFKSAYQRIKSLWQEQKEGNEAYHVNVQSIQFKGVSFMYQEKEVLKNVFLNVNKNDWVMVLGKTGAGKSTLFKLLTKQVTGNDLNVYVNQESTNKVTGSLIRKNITYVDQKLRLFSMTVTQNVYLDSQKAVAGVDEILSFMGVDKNKLIDNAGTNISGGQSQVVAILQALVNGGDVIIFDETTSQLDALNERRILKGIKRYFPSKTIILISHRGTNKDLFNKVINISHGKITRINKRREHEAVRT